MNNEEELVDTVGDERLAELEAAAERNASTETRIGSAESQRRQLKQKATEKITAAKEALKESKKALKEAKAVVVKLGPANMHLLSDARRAHEHNELCVEHYEAVLATLDRPEFTQRVQDWDQMFEHNPMASFASLFLTDITPEIDAMNEACQAFAQALAGMHRKFNASIAKASEANATVRALAEDGIRVRVNAPNLVVIQQLASGALRNALVNAGLGIGSHWIRECLRPDHYVDPATLNRKADAA